MREKLRKTLNKGMVSPMAKGMFIYSIGSLGSRAINFAVYPILTFFLLRDELGYYDLIVNTIYLLVPLATFQLSDGIYRRILPLDLAVEKQEVISAGISSLLISSTGILLAILLVSELFFNVQFGFLVYFMGLAYALNISFKQIVRGLKRNKAYVLSDILYSFIFVASLIAFLYGLRLGLKGVLYAFILANCFSICYLLLATEIPRYIRLLHIPKKDILKPLFKYSLPLIPNTLSWWFVGSANTYIITIMLGLASNGLYAIAFKFSSVIYLLNKIFTLAWQDQLIGSQSEDSSYNSRVLNRLLIFLLSLVGVLTLLSKPILSLIVKDEFYTAWQYVPFLLLATVFSSISSYFGAFYLSWHSTSKIFITTVYGAIVAVVSSLLLTHFFGLMGTSIAMALGFATVALIRYIDTRDRLQLKFYNQRLGALVLFVILAIFLNFTL